MGQVPAGALVDPSEEKHGTKPVLTSLDIDGLAKYIKQHNPRNIICMVGAGMSTAAGIPDFRSPGTGLYANLQRYNLPSPEDIFDIDYFREKPDAFYELARDLWPTGKKYTPTFSHYFVKMLEKQGRLLRCYTQNVDTLELLAGISPDRVIAAHGNFATAHALNGKEVPIGELEDAVLQGPEACRALAEKYGALVKPDIVFFGESLPMRFNYGVGADFPKCDLLLVLGTSLSVAPFNQLVAQVPDRCPRVLVNRERAGEDLPGGFDFDAEGSRDIFLRGDCDSVLTRLSHRLGFFKTLEKMFKTAVPHRAADAAPRARL